MDPKFSTLDFTPRARPTGYRVAVAVLALGLVGAVAGHLQAIGELRREFVEEATRGRACAEEREALGARLRTIRSSAEQGVAPTTTEPAPPVAPRTDPAPAATEPTPAGGAEPPSEQDVMSLVGAGQRKLQACYRRALRHDPNLGLQSVRLRLSFTLRGSGDVRSVAFSPAPGRELRSCLRDVVGRWRVRPFGGDPIAVEVPITLAPQG
jgi:hypothetical protein